MKIPADLSTSFKDACKNNDTKALEQILDKLKENSDLLKKILLEVYIYGTLDCITWACEKGHTDLVNKILEVAKDKGLVEEILMASDAFGFRLACRNGHTEIVKKILAEAKAVNLLEKILTEKGIIGFIDAFEKNRHEVVKLILVAATETGLLEKILTEKNISGLKLLFKESHSELSKIILVAAEPLVKNSIYLSLKFYKYINNNNKEKEDFVLGCSAEVKDIINICFFNLDWNTITNPEILFTNIMKLQEFGGVLDDSIKINIIRNCRIGNNMKLLFSNNSFLSWAIDHANKAIDQKTIKSDLNKVINPWLHDMSLQVNNNQNNFPENFQEKAYLILQYLIKFMDSPTIWFRIKYWFFQALASIGLISQNDILKSDQEYFRILLSQYKLTFGDDHLQRTNKLSILESLAKNNSFAAPEIIAC